MKKGDVVSREVQHKAGELICSMDSTEEKVKILLDDSYGSNYMMKRGVDTAHPLWWCIVVALDHSTTWEATVSWVVGDEAAVRFKDGGYRVIDLIEEPDWKVIRLATPSYQSTVAQMSDDQLRSSIDALRRTRVSAPAPKTRGGTRTKTESVSPIEKALKLLSPEKREALQRKLGLID